MDPLRNLGYGRWDGTGRDGTGWDGMGWDGMGWDGMGWIRMQDLALLDIVVAVLKPNEPEARALLIRLGHHAPPAIRVHTLLFASGTRAGHAKERCARWG